MNPRRKEEGAVLLTTILIMGIMAALAVAVMDDVRFGIKRAANVQAYAQADWYVSGAGDFAEAYLSGQMQSISKAQLGEALQTFEPILFPLEGGAMSISVTDGSQCFSLADLSNAQGQRVFTFLLGSLGWDTGSAARLTSAAVDWQDPDNQVSPGGAEDYVYLGRDPAYRAANQTFSSVTELRSLGELTEIQYQKIRPFLCARAAAYPTKVNVNSLHAEQAALLAAVIGGDGAMVAAQKLILDRPSGGYADESALLASPALADYSLKDSSLQFLTYEPSYIWVEANVNYLQAQRRAAFEFVIDEEKVIRLYRGFGDEAMRPKLETPPS